MAIKTIRFLFVLPIDSREFVFLRKDKRDGVGGRGVVKMVKKATKEQQNKTVQSEE